MKKKLQILRNNKVFRIICGVIKTIVVILILCILSVIIVQRLSNNKVTLGGYSIFTVISGSMEPEYKIGDMLLAKNTAPSKVLVGDNVVYLGNTGSANNKIITHKVMSKDQIMGKYFFTTKGTANDYDDPTVSEEQLYGVVIHRFTILSFISGLVNNVYGFYFVIFVPFVIIVFLEIIDVKKELKKNKEE